MSRILIADSIYKAYATRHTMKAEKLILQILSALFVCYSPIHAAETQQSY